MYNKKTEPTNWKHVNDFFKVSDAGAVAPNEEGPFEGRLSYLNLETCMHILNNIDSFRKAVEESAASRVKRELSKEMSKVVAALRAVGVDEATAIDQAAIILKQRKA